MSHDKAGILVKVNRTERGKAADICDGDNNDDEGCEMMKSLRL